MAQAPRHIRLDDKERLLPPSLVSISVKIRNSRNGSNQFPIRLSIIQAEQIIKDYKDLRERLGICRDELAYERGQGLRPKYGHTFVRKVKKATPVESKPKVDPKWAKVLASVSNTNNKPSL